MQTDIQADLPPALPLLISYALEELERSKKAKSKKHLKYSCPSSSSSSDGRRDRSRRLKHNSSKHGKYSSGSFSPRSIPRHCQDKANNSTSGIDNFVPITTKCFWTRSLVLSELHVD